MLKLQATTKFTTTAKIKITVQTINSAHSTTFSYSVDL